MIFKTLAISVSLSGALTTTTNKGVAVTVVKPGVYQVLHNLPRIPVCRVYGKINDDYMYESIPGSRIVEINIYDGKEYRKGNRVTVMRPFNMQCEVVK